MNNMSDLSRKLKNYKIRSGAALSTGVLSLGGFVYGSLLTTTMSFPMVMTTMAIPVSGLLLASLKTKHSLHASKILGFTDKETYLSDLKKYKSFNFRLFKHSKINNFIKCGNIALMEELADIILDNFSKELAIINTFIESDKYKQTVKSIREEYVDKQLSTIYQQAFKLFLVQLRNEKPELLKEVKFVNTYNVSSGDYLLQIKKTVMDKGSTFHYGDKSSHVGYYISSYSTEIEYKPRNNIIKIIMSFKNDTLDDKQIDLFFEDSISFVYSLCLQEKESRRQSEETNLILEKEKSKQKGGFQSVQDIEQHMSQLTKEGELS